MKRIYVEPVFMPMYADSDIPHIISYPLYRPSGGGNTDKETYGMTTQTLKACLISAAITHLNELVCGFHEDAKHHLQGVGNTDEGGFAGTFGDYSAQSTGNQLREQAMRDRAEAEKYEQTLAALKRLNAHAQTSTIQLMSLVETNHGTFLVSLATRPVELDGKKYMFLATDAPIYAEMVGKKAGDTFSFRSSVYHILAVY